MLKMKKVTLLLASLFLVACGHNWSEGDKKDFMDSCKDSPRSSTDKCECAWNVQTDHFDSEADIKSYNKRAKDRELEDSDYDLTRSYMKAIMDCLDDDDIDDMGRKPLSKFQF